MIIGGNYRHGAIFELQKDNAEAFNWTCERIPMYYNIYSDRKVLSALKKMRKSNLHNSSSTNVLPFPTFIDVIKSDLAYARPFHDSYEVPFEYLWIVDSINEVDSDNFIQAATRTTHYRYIRGTRLCLRCGDLLPLLKTLKIR